jgi:putative two-component system response regulator
MLNGERQARVLIVDDSEASRMTLAALLHEDNYEIHFAKEGPEALAMTAAMQPDIILLDQMMPGMTGVEVCERIRENPDCETIPIVFVTALDDRSSRLAAFGAGADDVISKPVDRLELRMRVRNITRLNRYRLVLESREDVHRMFLELQTAYDATIEGWARALEYRDSETKGHSDRVTTWAVQLAIQVGLTAESVDAVRRGALLHDIGKMAISDAILLKPGPLTPEEREIIERHPIIGRDLLAPIAYLSDSVDIPYCHHERWDGSGYPQGLAGTDIPFTARLFSVVDVFDALTSDRPYRQAWSVAETEQYLADNAGIQFDPEVVRVFLQLVESGLIMAQRTSSRVQ